MGISLLYKVVSVYAAQWIESPICVHSSSPCWWLPRPTHIPPIQVTTEHRAEQSSLYYTTASHLAISFTHDNVYTSIPISQFIPPSLHSVEFKSSLGSESCVLLTLSYYYPSGHEQGLISHGPHIHASIS